MNEQKRRSLGAAVFFCVFVQGAEGLRGGILLKTKVQAPARQRA